jgi:hypothetical protein
MATSVLRSGPKLKNSLIPRPGIGCKFVWSLDEAERLDDRGQLTKSVKERINQLLEALGEDKIVAVTSGGVTHALGARVSATP